MARGQQKIQSQQKAAEKQAKMKKQAGHSANDQKKVSTNFTLLWFRTYSFKVFLYQFIRINIFPSWQGSDID